MTSTSAHQRPTSESGRIVTRDAVKSKTKNSNKNIRHVTSNRFSTKQLSEQFDCVSVFECLKLLSFPNRRSHKTTFHILIMSSEQAATANRNVRACAVLAVCAFPTNHSIQSNQSLGSLGWAEQTIWMYFRRHWTIRIRSEASTVQSIKYGYGDFGIDLVWTPQISRCLSDTHNNNATRVAAMRLTYYMLAGWLLLWLDAKPDGCSRPNLGKLAWPIA